MNSTITHILDGMSVRGCEITDVTITYYLDVIQQEPSQTTAKVGIWITHELDEARYTKRLLNV